MASQFQAISQWCTVQCPHCWERIDIHVDASEGSQDYIEDCSVCCFPMLLHVHTDVDVTVQVEAE